MTEPRGPIDWARQQQTEREQRAEQPGRHTVDTITSDALDQLYARIDTLEHVAASNKQAYVDAVKDFQAVEEAALVLGAAYEWHLHALDRIRLAVGSLCHEPHPSHDHVCPDDVLRLVEAALAQPKEPRP
ncbi:hypothetical protein [Streptomyces sp. NBC_01565]|uniref:hypothetical protein n=1 Tax=Streptomyces sp. NBC_01565 TaxID=2975881 RepID=UPI00225C4201|nr:hypothetical protein [Streptomyces sp. NBC_01565]MCX4540473.1 hypothetical protein [Streptomyces sp. NBC_01565]